MDNPFDAFDSGSTATSPAPEANDFDQFGPATPKPSPGDRPQQTDWKSLMSNVDDTQNHMSPATRSSFEQLARNSNDTRNDTMMGLNMAYVKNRLPQLPMDVVTGNWRAVKDAFAKDKLGIDESNISDSKLYQAIGENEQVKQLYLSPEYKDAGVQDKLKMLGQMFIAHTGQRLGTTWDDANKPYIPLPNAPEIPDIPGYGMGNPALVAGVWNAVKPAVEGIESPLGLATMAAAIPLKAAAATSALAKTTLVGIGGIFTGLMAKQTYDAAKEVPDVFKDPNATLQDKITAIGKPVVSGGLALLAGFHTALESLPAKSATTLSLELKGKSAEDAVSVLRAEAGKQTSLEPIAALHDVADKLEQITPKALEEANAPKEDAEGKPVPVAKSQGPANIQAMDNGGFVVTDSGGKLIDFAATEEEARNLAEQSSRPEEEDKAVGKTQEAEVAKNEEMEADQEKEADQKIEKLTGIKNSFIDSELKEMGRPPATRGEKMDTAMAMEEGNRILAEDPKAGSRLVDELSDNLRAPKPFEEAILMREVQRLGNEREAAAKQTALAEKSGDPARIAMARSEEELAEGAYARAADITAKVGTESSHSLSFRRMLMKEDYSLARLEYKYKQANGGKTLSPEASAEIKTLQAKVMETQKAFDDYRSQQAKEVESQRARPPGKARARISDLANDARARIKARAAETGGKLFAGGLDPSDLPKHLANVADLAIIGAEHIANGLTKFADWSKKMAEEFGDSIKPHLKEIFEHSVDLGSEQNAEKAVETKKAQLESKITEAKRKLETGEIEPTPEGKLANRPAVKELEELHQTLDAVNQQLKAIRKGPPVDPQISRLEAYKRRTSKSIEAYNKRLENEDFGPRPKPQALPLDKEALKLKSALERAKQDVEVGRSRLAEQNKPGYQKSLNKVSDMARAGAISGYHTLGKLAAFSLGRFAEAPALQGASALIRRLPGMRDISAKANLEAGSEATALAKFYTKAATQGIADAWQTLKTGKSDLKAELGNARENGQPIHWYDYFGISHMAEKSPLLRGAFESHLEKATAHAIENGVDVSDPLIQGALRKQAFDYANRAILQDDNIFSQAVNSLTQRLEADNPKTGKPEAYRVVLSSLLKTFLTKGIVKTPANYVSEVFAKSPLGLARGVGEAAWAHIRGVDKLTDVEANTIHRLIVGGTVGTAMFTWGVIDATKKPEDRIFGGYYNPGEKRGSSDVGFARIRIGDTMIPHVASHLPLIEVAQMGSTMMRVAESKLHKKDKENAGYLTGALTAILSIGESAPVANPIIRMGKEGPAGTQQVFNDSIASLVPQLVQNIAEDTDDQKRAFPKTLGDDVKSRIPGLREDLPKAKAHK